MDDSPLIIREVFLPRSVPLLYFESTSLVRTHHQSVDANFRFAPRQTHLEGKTTIEDLPLCHPHHYWNRYFNCLLSTIRNCFFKAMATISELNFNMIGTIAAFASTIGFALQNLYTKKSLRDLNIHQHVLLQHLTFYGFFMLLTLWAFTDMPKIMDGRIPVIMIISNNRFQLTTKT